MTERFDLERRSLGRVELRGATSTKPAQLFGHAAVLAR
jgi:hypothetical protein